MTPQQAYEFSLLLLCNWREARGETKAAKLGQAWSVRNRVLRPSWWGKDWITVILKPLQYSSFNANDPNAVKLPMPTDISLPDCLEVCEEAYNGLGTDPVNGATHYFDKSLDSNPPSWAAEMTHVCDIDSLRFYK